MMKLHTLGVWVVLASAVSAPGLANALTTFSAYDDGAASAAAAVNSNAEQALFSAAAGPTNLITFEGQSLVLTNGLTVAPGVTLGIDPVAATGGNMIVNSDSSCNGTAATCGFNITSGGSQWVQVNGATLTFNFATPVTSFGAYLTGVQLGDAIQINGADVVGVPNPVMVDGGASFLGFTGSAPVTQVVILAEGPIAAGALVSDEIGVDNVQYTAAVPEPGAWAMMLLGVGAIGAALRLARRAGSTQALSAA